MGERKESAMTAESWAFPAQQERSRTTRMRVLAAAERVFAANGYDGARLTDIAAEAGYSVGTVYFRFKDKDALFFAIAENFVADARAKLADVLTGNAKGSQREIVERYVRAAAAVMRQHKGLFRAVVERGMEHPQALRVLFILREELASALEKALRETGKQPRKLPLIVRVMTQMVYGFLIAGVINPHAPTRIEQRHTIDELVAAMQAYMDSK